jgi:hypothetical protein
LRGPTREWQNVQNPCWNCSGVHACFGISLAFTRWGYVEADYLPDADIDETVIVRRPPIVRETVVVRPAPIVREVVVVRPPPVVREVVMVRPPPVVRRTVIVRPMHAYAQHRWHRRHWRHHHDW